MTEQSAIIPQRSIKKKSKFPGAQDNRNPENPHNYERFETEEFVSYSYCRLAHDLKYQKYLKSREKHN